MIAHMPFASDFRRARVPTERLGLELVKGAFLGFRRQATNRFIKALELHGNAMLEISRLGQSNSKYAHNLDSILQTYLGRMPLDQLLVLYQLNLKCTTTNSDVKYSFVEALSQSIVNYMREVTSHDTVGHFLSTTRRGLRTRHERYKRNMCDFLFESRDDLLRSRSEVLEGVTNCDDGKGSFVTFKRAGVSLGTHNGIGVTGGDETARIAPNPSNTAENEFINEAVTPGDDGDYDATTVGASKCDAAIIDATENGRQSNTVNSPTTYDPRIRALPLETRSEDCFLSTKVIAVVLGHWCNIKYWHKGFPFDSWINQYYAHNADVYHPVFARLYMAHILALIERNANPMNMDDYCDALKRDMMFYVAKKISIEETVMVRFNGSLYETKFELPELMEMFSTAKRLAQNAKFKEVYPWVVEVLTANIAERSVDAKVINTVANVCNRNDGVGGLEPLLQVLESTMMKNIDEMTCMDVCSLLQALHKHDLHSQDLVNAMADKLNTDDIDDLSISTIALSIQTLGRMQANFKNNGFLHRIAEMFVNNPQRFCETSESNCSGILWGFYKLHFKHPRFLEVALQRYSSKDLGTPNVNSLVISLTALTRFDSFTDPSVLVDIYKLVLRNISSMTISTSQQLVTCVTRMLENITLCCADQASYKHMRTISNKLINTTMKHVCERLMDQISTVQAGAMLNALHRSKQRTPDIVAPLIASIAGAHRKVQDWHSSLHMPKKSLYAYDAMPPCPFDVDVCAKKLEKVEITHLVGICEAIHGLDYWSPYSLHLMIQIQKHITPQLHDMKATHILSSCISFANWHFTDFQMEPVGVGNVSSQKLTREEMLQSVRTVVDYDLKKCRERSESWFEASMVDSPQEVDVMKHFKAMIVRTRWKEDFLLGCIESLHRHAHFLCAASMPLRRLKVMYDLLRYNVYLNHCSSPKIELPPERNEFASTKCPFLILEHTAPVRTSLISTIMPQNLTEFLGQLYSISRTESFHNFIFGEGSVTNGTVNGLEEEEEAHMDTTESLELMQNGKEVPTIRPLYAELKGDDKEWDLSASCYHRHQGSGAIIQLGDQYIYVDPVIGGFRTTVLVLDPKRHYVPHLVEPIYSSPN
ncbi:uncharacterized protein BcabD6B2_04100 [Babesia caballi]|uniref:RAP domain-containing protein n=1 Tax=Babesia caballi TaxID=5871 RepID=A0AAV4LNF4_BABCB|nr:hypothetical protein, conserved [Babesia caballi]